ncbi:helix-turn-helix transcriptional regulator [Streptomyces sp. SMC 277]|uniref:Helix-turn-helix transcriptional regulator n=1 Tax=Streptomyces antimicrobicus TaxID=2883108 RepID=A0ABS8BEM8_9ACTN|nr:helix-turn-helix domain-containing protein [Streptomyces antimicrobicus]MCB5183071.1 helix-turn-helix transcriptional regulator [Streptomyces antimicrobicus]
MEEAESAAALGGDVFAADCRARVAFEVLAGRWDSVVVYCLGENGPMRPRALLDRIGGISPKSLNEALRRLEYNGLVVRRRYAEAPPRVDYALTEAGADLLPAVRALGAWAGRHADAVLAAQERFTSAGGDPAGADPA